MKKSWLFFTIVLVLFSACKAQNKTQSSEWKEFVSEEGKFKVLFPENPRISVKTTPAKNQSNNFEVTLPQVHLLVMYADLPANMTMDEAALRTNYNLVRDGLLKTVNATLQSERDIWLDKKLGRELILKKGDGTVIYRMYLVGNRHYQTIATTHSSLTENPQIEKDINKFSDSFQLIEK